MHGRKINGSKSRKCTLPHERLTKKGEKCDERRSKDL